MIVIEASQSTAGIKKLLLKLEGVEVSEVATVIKEDINANFEQSRTPFGYPLLPLPPERIKAKTKKGFLSPSKPLVASGQVANSTTVKNISKNESHVVVKNRRTRTADNPKGAIPTNTQILKWNQKLRPVWGLSERVILILKRRLKLTARQK